MQMKEATEAPDPEWDAEVADEEEVEVTLRGGAVTSVSIYHPRNPTAVPRLASWILGILPRRRFTKKQTENCKKGLEWLLSAQKSKAFRSRS